MIGEQPIRKLREHSSMIITGINSEFSKSVFDVIHSLLGEQDTYMNSVFRVEELKSQMNGQLQVEISSTPYDPLIGKLQILC